MDDETYVRRRRWSVEEKRGVVTEAPVSRECDRDGEAAWHPGVALPIPTADIVKKCSLTRGPFHICRRARWRLAGLLTFLPPQKVQQVLDSCDRTTPIGLRDYAILMLLAKLGLRAGEVVALTLDDIDWRAGEILVHGKGRRQAVMPSRRNVGAAVVSYLRQGRPTSTSRHLFLRMLAPHVGFTSGCAITMIARQALGRAGIHGVHLFRHSLATDLLRSGASFDEIGQLLRHESTDSTRIYAKLYIEKLRTLSQPWPGGVQ